MTSIFLLKRITWIIGMSLGIMGVIGYNAHVQILTEYMHTIVERLCRARAGYHV